LLSQVQKTHNQHVNNSLGRLVSKLRAVSGLSSLQVKAGPLNRRRQPRREITQAGTLMWNGHNNGRQVEVVRVEDISVHGMGLRLARPLPVGQTVWFEPNGGAPAMIKGVIRHCEEQDGQCAAGLVRVENERRRTERQPVRGSGTLDWYGPGGKASSTQVSVRDVSEFGLQLSATDPVPVGCATRLIGEAIGCVGTVCYCTPAGGEYLIGLHFTSEPYNQEAADYKGN
jgi:hypothetical protein